MFVCRTNIMAIGPGQLKPNYAQMLSLAAAESSSASVMPISYGGSAQAKLQLQ